MTLRFAGQFVCCFAFSAAAAAYSPLTASGQARDAPVELTVMISPGFAAAYDVLVAEFARARGVSIVTVRGGSTGDGPGAIPGRIARGEAADVVIVAVEGMMEMIAAGTVDASSRVDLARTGVGVAVRRNTPRPDVSSVESLRRALLEAESVAYSRGPSGTHVSAVVLPALGIVDQVVAKAVITNNVPDALASGGAELGFQQVSELVPVSAIDFAGPLPEELQLFTDYAAALVAGTRHPDLARALIDHLASDAADPVVARVGLTRVE